MLHTVFSRRRVLTLSSLSLGGMLLAAPLAWAADETELSRLIQDIILEHYPKAREQQTMVNQFIKDLLAQKVESLESRSFLNEAAGRADRSALERYVLVQFMTSPGFIALQK